MKFLLVFLGILCLFNLASSIKCYDCEATTKSLAQQNEDCNKVVEDCPETNNCVKEDVFFSGTQVYVQKYCGLSGSCDPEEPYTKLIDNKEFIRYCCKEDLCNGSENLSKNKLLFCAVIFHAVSKLFL